MREKNDFNIKRVICGTRRVFLRLMFLLQRYTYPPANRSIFTRPLLPTHLLLDWRSKNKIRPQQVTGGIPWAVYSLRSSVDLICIQNQRSRHCESRAL